MLVPSKSAARCHVNAPNTVHLPARDRMCLSRFGETCVEMDSKVSVHKEKHPPKNGRMDDAKAGAAMGLPTGTTGSALYACEFMALASAGNIAKEGTFPSKEGTVAARSRGQLVH